MTLLGFLAAFLVGIAIVYQTESLPLGLFGGIGIGFVLARLQALTQAVAALRAEVAELRGAARADIAASPRPATKTETAPEPAIGKPAEASPPQTPSAPSIPPPRVSTGSGLAEKAAAALKRWFTEGNVPVKIGMLVLFAGVAALLKLAADQGWLSLPIELRLAGVALAATAALAFGWRQRHARRSFALSLQGGAIGVLLLTVFAAFRLYGLLSPVAAFALMLVLVAGTGVLAVLQDALALAVLGILAGFAAPILISTGSGNHVVLFAYYALLNLAIFAIAWLRPWRALNLLGFVFTYAIGTTWGVLRYRSELFESVEPFLIVYFLIYLAIPILYARQHRIGEPQRRDLVDGTLVFGNPLIAFALQAALLEGARLPLAYSALALAAVYALLAWQLLPRARVRVPGARRTLPDRAANPPDAVSNPAESCPVQPAQGGDPSEFDPRAVEFSPRSAKSDRLLGESFAVLAVGFATLAVPLALSARSTACTFALEGAALVWLGLRQQHRLPRLAGLALQALAAGAFLFALLQLGNAVDATPIANGTYAGALLIAGAAFISAWLHDRAEDVRPTLALPLYLWGLLWWLGAGMNEIDRFVDTFYHAHAVLAFAALTALLAALTRRSLPRAALAWTAAAMVAGALLLVLGMADGPTQLYKPAPLAALAAYAACGWFALRTLRHGDAPALRLAHLGWLWTWTIATVIALYQVAIDARLADGWRDGLAALPLIAAWAIALIRPAWLAPPLGERFDRHRGLLLISQAVVGTLAFVALLWHTGASTPLPFVPLLNPVELAQLGLLLCFARWLADPTMATLPPNPRALPLALAGFAFVTMATLRAVHHYDGVPWGEPLWQSNLAQTALTVVWSLLGVVAWILGSRRGQRILWLAGAILMGLVLAKLLLIDRLRLGNLFGIASFIAYGVLCTVIGYFAPAPARAQTESA